MATLDIRSSIASSYLAQGFTDEFIDKMVDIATVEDYAPGDYLTKESEPKMDLMLLVEGSAEIRTVTDEVIGYLKSGMPFGEVAFIDEKPRSSSVVAVAACKVVVLPEPELRALLRDDPVMAVRALLNLSRLLCHRLRRANQQIAALQAIEESMQMKTY